MTRGRAVQIGSAVASCSSGRAHLRRPLHRLAGHELPAGDARRPAASRSPAARVAARRRRAAPACGAAHARRAARVRDARRRRTAPGAVPGARHAGAGHRHLLAGDGAGRRRRAERWCAPGSSSREPVPKAGDAVWLAHRRPAHLLLRATRSWSSRSSGMKPVNQKAWLLILPVLVCVAFSAILPLMTVVNYSVQDIISPERRVFVGTEWFKAVMRDDDLHGALLRQLGFSLAVLAGRDPARHRAGAGDAGQGLAGVGWCWCWWRCSLLIPWNVVGTIWQIFGRADIGLLGAALAALGFDYNYTGNATHAWLTVLVMDVWHWTPLVALLCYAGLRAIPDAYYQAARIDGASQVRGVPLHPAAQAARRADDRRAAALHGQLHDLHRAVRADRRRPGQRDHLPQPVPDAEGGRPVRPRPGGGVLADLLPDHPAAVLRPLQLDAARRHRRQRRPAMDDRRFKKRTHRSWSLYLVFAHPAHLLDGQHVVQDERGDPVQLLPAGRSDFTLANYRDHLHRRVLVLGLHQLADLRRASTR